MCQHVGLIEDVVNDFVNNGQMFTAHNVTAEVRRRTKDRVAHDDVKRDVHKMFNDGAMFSYNRSLASLQNVNPQPWIYHPLNSDASQYDGKPSVAATVATPVLPVPTPNSISTNGDETYKLDTTDRLCIPAKLVRQAGLAAGQVVIVLAMLNDKELVLTGAGNAAKIASSNAVDLITSYVVDSYDNIRITRGALQKGHLSGTEFEIEGDGDKITVRESK
jgi:bifunctional DNA-binding transcriptional regulator/antitoxin component of YhaV-PrlF toxin-antitoxin module